jgi:hypothetical protein
MSTFGLTIQAPLESAATVSVTTTVHSCNPIIIIIIIPSTYTDRRRGRIRIHHGIDGIVHFPPFHLFSFCMQSTDNIISLSC